MKMVPIKDVKRGEFLKRTAKAEIVLVRGHYCSKGKRYYCYYADDVNREVVIKATADVYVDFEY